MHNDDAYMHEMIPSYLYASMMVWMILPMIGMIHPIILSILLIPNGMHPWYVRLGWILPPRDKRRVCLYCPAWTMSRALCLSFPKNPFHVMPPSPREAGLTPCRDILGSIDLPHRRR